MILEIDKTTFEDTSSSDSNMISVFTTDKGPDERIVTGNLGEPQIINNKMRKPKEVTIDEINELLKEMNQDDFNPSDYKTNVIPGDWFYNKGIKLTIGCFNIPSENEKRNNATKQHTVLVPISKQLNCLMETDDKGFASKIFDSIKPSFSTRRNIIDVSRKK